MRHGQGFRHQLVGRDGLVDQADAFGFASIDEVTGKEQFTRLGRTHEILHQAHGSARDRRGDLGLGRAEFGAIRGHADIAGQGQFIAAAEGIAVDRCNGRLGKADDLPGDLLQVGQVVPVGCQAAPLGVLQVGTGGKGPARAGEYQHPDRILAAGLFQGPAQVEPELLVHGVEHLGTVERNHGRPVLLFV